MSSREPATSDNCDGTMDSYTSWICRECAIRSGGKPRDSISTYNENKCGVCGKVTSVTRPRNYGYPNFERIGINERR